tara:strand:- start:899 stop:1171 length:273 start_codon:yes stop_codon:yes gene_type:complete
MVITIEEALECFKPYRPLPNGIPLEIIGIVEDKRLEKRLEIMKNIEEVKIKKMYGNKTKIVYNKNETRKEKIMERLQMKLLMRKQNKIGD